MSTRSLTSIQYKSFRRLYRVNVRNLLKDPQAITNCNLLIATIRNILNYWETGLGERPNIPAQVYFAGGLSYRTKELPNGKKIQTHHIHVSNSLGKWILATR